MYNVYQFSSSDRSFPLSLLLLASFLSFPSHPCRPALPLFPNYFSTPLIFEQVFVGDPVPAGAGPQPGEPGSELNITFPVSGANATIPIYPLFTGNLSCSVYNWQTLQVNQTTVNAPAGANYSG